MHALLVAAILGAPAPAYDVAVVCPDALVQALDPWVAHRTAQGHRLIRIRGDQTADAIRDDIRRVAEGGQLKTIVLVGDAPTRGQAASSDRPTIAPYLAQARVNIHWGSEKDIASDDWYADLDDDQLPDVSIGRLPADSPDDLKGMVAKILAYERSTDFGVWRRRVNFLAGAGGFGRLADTAIELGARQLIGGGLPGGYHSTMTYASQFSPYCPDPHSLSATALSRLNEGSLFWVYMGHGQPWALAPMKAAGQSYRLLDVRDMKQLKSQAGMPIAFFMACYVGAFDAPRDCLGEQMLRAPGGPVAVIAGSRVTMPYGMSLLATGMLDECFEHRARTLGAALLRAKRNMVLGQVSDARRATLDLLASLISPAADQLAEERLEHVHLFNLLGDPLLRIRHPQAIGVSVAPQAQVGSMLEVRASTPVAGVCRVELVAARDRLSFTPPVRKAFDGGLDMRREMQTTYTRANQPVLTSSVVQAETGAVRTVLHVPEAAVGRCQVRVFIEGDSDFALGAAPVEVVRPAEDPPE